MIRAPIVVLSAGAALAACADASLSDPARADGARTLAAEAAEAEVRPGEADLAALAREVPGAGGFYFDEAGRLVVLVRDRGRAEAAGRQVLARLRATGRGHHLGREPAVVGVPALFDFFELNAARNRISAPVLDIAGVAYVDLDEAANRVVIGVSDPGAQPRVEARLRSLAVPRGMVTISAADEISAPLEGSAPLPQQAPYETSLNSLARPFVGGMQIGRRISDPEKFSKCTAGFTGHLDDGTRVLVTNSHCSRSSWDWDGAVFYQPAPSRYDETYRVGTEYRDRQGSSCGFLSPNVCRSADATAVRIDGGIEVEIGALARTRYAAEGSNGVGSLAIDPANPRFRVTRTGGFPFKGQLTNKVGATTGWTRGMVARTCVDVDQPDRSWSTLRCQSATYAGVQKGDSGSPVFSDHGDGTATLEGILFGSSSGLFWWSPFHGIETDLGRINVFPLSYGGGGGGSGSELPPPDDCTVDPTLPC